MRRVRPLEETSLGDQDHQSHVGDGTGEAAKLIEDPPRVVGLEVVANESPGFKSVDGNADEESDGDRPAIDSVAECAGEEAHAIEGHADEHHAEDIGEAELVVARCLEARTPLARHLS